MGEFRSEYREVGRLRYLLSNDRIPIAIVSATLPPPVLRDVTTILQIHEKNLCTIRRSNDRPNVNLVVRQMKHPANSFKDLSFLIPEDWKGGDEPPQPFVVFFDDKNETVQAASQVQTQGQMVFFKHVDFLQGDNRREAMVWRNLGHLWNRHIWYG